MGDMEAKSVERVGATGAPGSQPQPQLLPPADLDLSLVKRFSVTERIKLQFRAEAFNALNHANFDNPANLGTQSIQSASFAQVCCSTVAPPTTQTIIQTGESARVLQLGLKLDF